MVIKYYISRKKKKSPFTGFSSFIVEAYKVLNFEKHHSSKLSLFHHVNVVFFHLNGSVPRVSIGSKELCDGSSNCGSLVESGLQDDLLVDNDNNDNNVVNLNLEFNEVGFALRVFDEMLVSGTVSM